MQKTIPLASGCPLVLVRSHFWVAAVLSPCLPHVVPVTLDKMPRRFSSLTVVNYQPRKGIREAVEIALRLVLRLVFMLTYVKQTPIATEYF
jgi:hypothetical protein